MSRPAVGPTQPLTQWVKGALSLELKRLARETDHLQSSSADDNNEYSNTSTPSICLLRVHKENCNFLHFNNITLLFHQPTLMHNFLYSQTICL